MLARRGILLLAGLAMAQAAAAQDRPRCASGLSQTRAAICADRTLAALEDRLRTVEARALRSLRRDQIPAHRRDVLLWRAWRESCRADRPCVKRRTEARIAELTGAAQAPLQQAEDTSATHRWRDGKFETVFADGSTRWQSPGGSSFGTVSADGLAQTFSLQQTPAADLPTLPPTHTNWATGLEEALTDILSVQMSPQDMAAYVAAYGDNSYFVRLDYHLRAIRFFAEN